MTRRTKVVLSGVAGVILGVAFLFAWAVYHTNYVMAPNAYAVWWTADLVIEHMETHAGAWPRNWEELQATSDQAYKGTTSTNHDGTLIAEFRPRATIQELQKRVEIDWNADPLELAKTELQATGRPFRVIWLRNGKSTAYSGKEPNTMILEYLKWKENLPDGAANGNQSIRSETNRTSSTAGFRR